MHAEVSGTVDFYEKMIRRCLKRLRSLVAHLPKPKLRKKMARQRDAARPRTNPTCGYDLTVSEGQKTYDARDLHSLRSSTAIRR